MLFYIIDAIIWLLLSGLYIILYYRRFNNALKNKSIRLYRVTPKAFVIVLTLITLIASGTNLIVSGQDEHISMIDYEIDEYTVNNYDDASMVILDDSVSKAGLSLEIHYYGEDEGTYSSWFTIYVYQDNAWNKLDYISEEIPLWTMIGYRVEKNHPNEMSINWEELYGELSSGRYLIVKQFSNHLGPGEADIYYLACEFIV